MVEVLEFVFKDFWHFLGSVIILGCIAEIFSAIFTRKTVIVKEKEDKE
jgi:hypothetical protein